MYAQYTIPGDDKPHPTIVCVKPQLDCIGNSKVLMQNMQVNASTEYQCKCSAGYYATNDSVALKCQLCPMYMTSENGAENIDGCFCRPGTWVKSDTSMECVDCMQTQEGSQSFFCPGRGVKIPCPMNTSISHRFASTIASCLPDHNMFFSVSLGYFVYCDILPYRNAEFTTWLTPGGQVCSHTCVSPGVVLTSDNTCRCDSEKGYSLLPAITGPTSNLICRCRPGWFMYGLECTRCPQNSFCADGISQNICPITRRSPRGSIVLGNCSCAPGYSPSTQEQSTACIGCVKKYKCDGNRRIECGLEEICTTRRIFLPETCQPGNTKYKQSGALSSCAYLYNTYSQPAHDVALKNELHNMLFVNIIQQPTPNLYAVDNIEILNVVAAPAFQEAMRHMMTTNA